LLYEIRATKPQNLLNPANIHNGSILHSSGQVAAPRSNRCYFDYIPVHSDDTIYFTSKNETPTVYAHLFLYSEPSEATFVQSVHRIGQITVGNNVGYKYTIPQDGYIRGIWVQDENFTCDEIVDPMLEISPTPHEYVPYQVYMPGA